MGARGCARIEFGAVEADEGDLLGLQMPHQLGIAVLQADEKLAAIRLHEVTELAHKPLGQVRHRKLRMLDLEVDRIRKPGEP